MSEENFDTPQLKPIQATFDPSFMLMSMRMWRDAVDMKVPVHDTFKIHFMNNREELLRGFAKTASAWLTMLSHLKPDEESAGRLEIVRKQADEFQKWAEDELKLLNDMALQSQMEAGIKELLDDPITGEATREMIRKLAGGKDKT